MGILAGDGLAQPAEPITVKISPVEYAGASDLLELLHRTEARHGRDAAVGLLARVLERARDE